MISVFRSQNCGASSEPNASCALNFLEHEISSHPSAHSLDNHEECEYLIELCSCFSVGLYIAGKILVNAGFVTLDLNFNLEKEPKLNLNTDVDFSSENILCMQLSQPNDVFR